jgi:hydrogenase expression/formation protein HypE
VVPRGAADRLFINTAGVGLVREGVEIAGANARPGDRVILSGTMADHGMTVLTQREGVQFQSDIKSDTAALNGLVARMLDAHSAHVHVLRDPTRGGVGTTLNEIAQSSRVGVKIREDRLPVRDAVAGVCELLGFDPLYVANEGKLIAFVAEEQAESVLEILRADPLGKEACIIGEAVADHPGKVFMESRIGGNRIVGMLAGEQLPRIC